MKENTLINKTEECMRKLDELMASVIGEMGLDGITALSDNDLKTMRLFGETYILLKDLLIGEVRMITTIDDKLDMLIKRIEVKAP